MDEEQMPENAGRGTDTVMAHMSLGEIVIPRVFQDDPEFMGMLQSYFQEQGMDIGEFTVGDPANKINPETGYPEFFSIGHALSRAFRGVTRIIRNIPGASILAPAALSYFAPGIGSALGGAILGEGAAGASTLGNALIGGGLGAVTGGGLKGALTGAVSGGLGANIGNFADAPLGEGVQGPVRAGSGALGALGNATGLNTGSSISGLIGGSSGGGSTFNLGNSLSSAIGGYGQDEALKKAQKNLLSANNQQLSNLESFDPSGITSDPGYQFNLEQGEKGLNRSLGAQGNVFSGRALQAASDYNQNYANNAFKDYYQRWLDKTNSQNALYGSSGDVRANAGLARASNLGNTLSSF